MPGEVVVEHRYPQAGLFVQEHGPYVVAVLEDLVCHAEQVNGDLVVQASSREVAARLGFLSKDSANRRIRQLQRAGVLRVAPGSTSGFAAPTYLVCLDGTGITLLVPTAPHANATGSPKVAHLTDPLTLFSLPDSRS